MGKFVDIPVGHFTGTPAISIPIHTLREGPLQVPVSVNYHGGGIRASEAASWVGLGWSLNAGGVISRTVLGIPDESTNGGYLNNTHHDDLSDPAVLDNINAGLVDGEPDLFTFSFPGGSGKFVINHTLNTITQFPKSDLRIEATPDVEEFTITTPDGTRYLFGQSGS